ncbi:MAG: hypothetical protein LBK59_05225 [Bifidobacteriaceae bacterium]|jgi:hypothetical protein|nr:hypothetical protein [Bifidobacteriaceae bacterium]
MIRTFSRSRPAQGMRQVAVALVCVTLSASGLAGCSSAPAADLLPTGGAQRPTADSGDLDSAGGAADSGGAGNSSPLSMADAAQKFVECMREQGVEMDDPDQGGGIKLHVDPDSAELTEAAQAICQPIMDQAEADAPDTGGRDEEQYDKLLAAAQCMRDKGYDYPDPQMDARGRISQKFRLGEGSATDTESMHRDQEACQSGAGLVGGAFGAGGASGGEGPGLDSAGE